ncbi:inovirus-type Gp2 protein [Thiomicrorhabdus sp. Kp2]|uniref:YagK/YfjJ domain-containing protein n=1 Tax=Thiomicrorhabdus sp. Kp2 TaxID=1123518 RepID=UPI0003F866B7|nr:inovirus-type Gp2 protein [Thiomicrorhabdus sp. Kp2]
MPVMTHVLEGNNSPLNTFNSFSGFVSAVLYHETVSNPLWIEGFRDSKVERKKRIFLISNNSSSTNSDRKLTNRKYVTYSNTYKHESGYYDINVAKKSGCYTQVLSRMIDQLLVCYKRWKRVFVLRFDLHYKIYTQDNKVVSDFMRRVRSYIKRNYQAKEVGFCWVREVERVKVQHYHVVLFLDGDKIRHSSKLNKVIKGMWERNTCGTKTMPTIPNPYYWINDMEGVKDVVWRISYMAKERGKGYRGVQAKDYSASRLKS